MKNTDISDPQYFHKVVDCQYACPAHTPVPENIRLIAAGRYSDAYMINWKSNVFPGILGRTCDRPCEPACRRVRVEDEPVAICRLKRVAADYKDDITARLPRPAQKKNGKRVALVGGGPASLTVARDLAPLGYGVTVFDADAKAGGMIRTQIPKFRLPDSVIDEETGYILGLGVDFRAGTRVNSMKALLAEGWTRSSSAPARRAAAISTFRPQGSGEKYSHRHRLAVVGVVRPCQQDRQARRRPRRRQHRDGLLPFRAPSRRRRRQCRGAFRLRGNEGVALEKEDAMHEGIPIHNFLVPKEFTHENGKLTGITFEKVKAEKDAKGRRKLVNAGEPDQHFPCDDVLVAVGQENAFPWIERDNRHRVRRMEHAEGRQGDLCLDQSESVFRRRRRVRAEEHHLGGGAWPRGRRVDRQAAQRRGHRRPPRAGGRPDEPEDGHPRMVLRQRDRAG